jgi:homoserine dehydrogenase
MELTPDLVVDALPGLEPSREIVEHFISRGIRVVSANKTAIEERIRCNSDSDGQSLLRYSASVGGSTPMLETVERIAARTRVKSIAAVLNGTCNFVLDCCARGAELEEALAEARRLGFAELDASDDLKGHDARRKLNILSRHAFGALPASIDVQVLNLNVANQAAEGRPHTALRQIARISTHGDHLHASIGFESMPRDSFFGKLDREWNGIEIRTEDGNCFSSCGRGAGRWPTTEAVMADLFDFRRARYGNVAKDG